MAVRWRFEGEIAAFGTGSGCRVVVGRWPASPLGAFGDAMVEHPDGTRWLIAPSEEVADFVAGTYRFDAVHVGPVEMTRTPGALTVAAGPLRARLAVGRRGPLGLVLRAVPRPIATSPAWATLVDPLARSLLPGVRTRGSAGAGRREWYGAWDLHPLDAVSATWDGTDLGAMRAVHPPVRFGFGSAPRTPSIVRITTTVRFG